MVGRVLKISRVDLESHHNQVEKMICAQRYLFNRNRLAWLQQYGRSIID